MVDTRENSGGGLAFRVHARWKEIQVLISGSGQFGLLYRLLTESAAPFVQLLTEDADFLLKARRRSSTFD
jgi:hypothetical protein